jgi:hypothetical protein
MMRALWLDFALFWGIKVPAFITRFVASLPPAHLADRAALFILAVALPLIWWTR